MFLLEMIPHHAGGLPPAHRGRLHVQECLSDLADAIYTNQSKEIGEMITILEAMRH